MTQETWDTGAALAQRNERKLFIAAQPLGWAISKWAMKRHPDVWHMPGLGYVVSGAEVTREILLDGKTYTKTGPASTGVLMTQVLGEYALLNMDGPPHISLRRKLQDLFTPKYVRAVTDQVLGQLATGLHDDLAAGREVDVARFARVFTGTLLCHLTGMELEGDALERRALELHDVGAQLTALVPLRVRRLNERKVKQARELFARLVDGTDQAYRSGSPDTIPGRMREIGLSLDEARGVIGILMLAGTETTSTAIGRLVALLCDTGQWTRLRQDPGLLDGAIDEGLRVVTPVPAFTRTIARDHELCGVQLKANRLLLGFMTNACRDPRVIADADHFDIGRDMPRPLRHLWFGAGPHFCLGFNLAKRELSMVLEAIMRLEDEVEVVDRRAARGVLLPTYERLVIRMKEAGQ
ncbi:cytochrome P450 [Mycobacterium intermedium]|uniref:Cytochrome P450 n=2 Tax=Mycobacterium intermedium TaxID=28445 RepID=A0A1E3SCS4_MYCIE|nr:hypothetical protein BHQ20_15275 [Mycobacterium intermedium]OPE48633.1 cytochrome P450 [Mycobacterium intermedium]ORB08288.1 cytochrome P450 [Mycobacterium intermedium]